MKLRLIAAGGCVVLLLGACSSGAPRDASPTTTTTTVVNPDVVPAQITPAYVNSVFRVLNHLDGDVSRSLLTNKRLSSQAMALLHAIYNDPLFEQEVSIAKQSLGGDLSNVRRPGGDVVTSVVQLIYVSTTCIFVATTSDFSAVLVQRGPPAASEYFRLSRKQSGDDPGHFNPTPWALSFNVDYPTPTRIQNQCPE